MPVDARSLLRASAGSQSFASASSSRDRGATSAQHGGLQDPFASYHPKTRMLRCAACDYQPVKHESLWASHTASKTHRQNAQAIRLREEEKRSREYGDSSVLDIRSASDKARQPTGKRKQEVESQADDGDGVEQIKKARPASTAASDDAEWARFQNEVLNAQASSGNQHYSHGAVIEVEPVMRTDEPVGGRQDDEDDNDIFTQERIEETPAEREERREREEREEILARLEDEQRQQEEADERAKALRARFEAMRRARLERTKGGM